MKRERVQQVLSVAVFFFLLLILFQGIADFGKAADNPSTLEFIERQAVSDLYTHATLLGTSRLILALVGFVFMWITKDGRKRTKRMTSVLIAMLVIPLLLIGPNGTYVYYLGFTFAGLLTSFLFYVLFSPKGQR